MSATPDELKAEAARWLRFAAEDLEAAEALRSAPGVAARHVATLARQAAARLGGPCGIGDVGVGRRGR